MALGIQIYYLNDSNNDSQVRLIRQIWLHFLCAIFDILKHRYMKFEDFNLHKTP